MLWFFFFFCSLLTRYFLFSRSYRLVTIAFLRYVNSAVLNVRSSLSNTRDKIKRGGGGETGGKKATAPTGFFIRVIFAYVEPVVCVLKTQKTPRLVIIFGRVRVRIFSHYGDVDNHICFYFVDIIKIAYRESSRKNFILRFPKL